jgi:TonB family protein
MLIGRMVPAASGSSAIDARLVEMPGAGSAAQGESAKSANQASATGKSAPGAPPVSSRRKADADSGLARPSHALAHRPLTLRNAQSQELRAAEFPGTRKSSAEAATAARQTPKRRLSVANQTGSSVAVKAQANAVTVSSGATRPVKSAAEGAGAETEQAGAPGTGEVSHGGGGTGPRPIYAPVPSIPDDLRDEVMEATAVVRFHVAPNGTATVALLTPTGFTVLDQLILDTLSNWRFHPATRGGAPVRSDAEVRLKITVQ